MRIAITAAFSAYPDGVERAFVPGERPTDLPEGWPGMLVDKGLAEEISDAASPAEPEPEPDAGA